MPWTTGYEDIGEWTCKAAVFMCYITSSVENTVAKPAIRFTREQGASICSTGMGVRLGRHLVWQPGTGVRETACSFDVRLVTNDVLRPPRLE